MKGDMLTESGHDLQGVVEQPYHNQVGDLALGQAARPLLVERSCVWLRIAGAKTTKNPSPEAARRRSVMQSIGDSAWKAYFSNRNLATSGQEYIVVAT